MCELQGRIAPAAITSPPGHAGCEPCRESHREAERDDHRHRLREEESVFGQPLHDGIILPHVSEVVARVTGGQAFPFGPETTVKPLRSGVRTPK